MAETEIGGRMVPVMDGPRSIVTFSGGAKGPHEAGRFAFWFAVFDSAKGAGHVGRGAEDGDPGERFRRHPEDPLYDQMRKELAGCEFVAAAPVEVVEYWLREHRKDAAFAIEAEIGGQRYRVADCKLIPAE